MVKAQMQVKIKDDYLIQTLFCDTKDEVSLFLHIPETGYITPFMMSESTCTFLSTFYGLPAFTPETIFCYYNFLFHL
jgi:hypothetical protein